jgi:metal-dependent HD superfamily phosphatase/phosphodiesterase
MSRHHAQLLRTIFHDPPSGNVHWRDIESLLRHVGAELEPLSGARYRVTIGRMEYVLHRPHHSNTLNSTSLVHLRTFLARAGVTPSAYETKDEGKPA